MLSINDLKPSDILLSGGGVTSGSGIIIGIFLSPIVVAAGISADLYNRHNPDASFYCSELIAIAFEKAGVPSGSGAASTTPKDISRSHVLNYVGDLKRAKSPIAESDWPTVRL